MPAPNTTPFSGTQFQDWASFFGGNVTAPQAPSPSVFGASSLGQPPSNGQYTGGWAYPDAWANFYEGNYGFQAPQNQNSPAGALAATEYANNTNNPNDPNLLGWEQAYGNPSTILQQDTNWAQSLGQAPVGQAATGGWANPEAWAAFYGGTNGFTAPANAGSPASALAAASQIAATSNPQDNPGLLGWVQDFGQPGSVLANTPNWAASLGTPQVDANGTDVGQTNTQGWSSPLAWASYYGGFQGFQNPVDNTLQAAQNWEGVTNANDPSLLGWELDYGNPQTVVSTIEASPAYQQYQQEVAAYNNAIAQQQTQQNQLFTNQTQDNSTLASLNPSLPAGFTAFTGLPGVWGVEYVNGYPSVWGPGTGFVPQLYAAPGASYQGTYNAQIAGNVYAQWQQEVSTVTADLNSGAGPQNALAPPMPPGFQPTSAIPGITGIEYVNGYAYVWGPGSNYQPILYVNGENYGGNVPHLGQVGGGGGGGGGGGPVEPILNEITPFAVPQPGYSPATSGLVLGNGSYTGYVSGAFAPTGINPLSGDQIGTDIGELAGNPGSIIAPSVGSFISPVGYSSGLSPDTIDTFEATYPGLLDQVGASQGSPVTPEQTASFIAQSRTSAGTAALQQAAFTYGAPSIPYLNIEGLPQVDTGGYASYTPPIDVFPAENPSGPSSDSGNVSVDDYGRPIPDVGPPQPFNIPDLVTQDLPPLQLPNSWLGPPEDTSGVNPGVTVDQVANNNVQSGGGTSLGGSIAEQFSPPISVPETSFEFSGPPEEPTFATFPTLNDQAAAAAYTPPSDVFTDTGFGADTLYQKGGYGQPVQEQLPPPEPFSNAEQFVQKYGTTTTLRQILSDATPDMLQGNALSTVLWALGKGVDTPIDLTQPGFMNQLRSALEAGGGWSIDKVIAGLTAAMKGGPQAVTDAAQDVQQDRQEGPGAYGQLGYTTVPVYGAPQSFTSPPVAPQAQEPNPIPPADIPYNNAMAAPPAPYDLGAYSPTAPAPSFSYSDLPYSFYRDPSEDPIQAGYNFPSGSFGGIEPFNFSSAPFPQGGYGGGSPDELSQSFIPLEQQLGLNNLDNLQYSQFELPGFIAPHPLEGLITDLPNFGVDWSKFNPTPSLNVEDARSLLSPDFQAGYQYPSGAFGEIDPYNFSSAPFPAGGFGGGSPTEMLAGQPYIGGPEFAPGAPGAPGAATDTTAYGQAPSGTGATAIESPSQNPQVGVVPQIPTVGDQGIAETPANVYAGVEGGPLAGAPGEDLSYTPGTLGFVPGMESRYARFGGSVEQLEADVRAVAEQMGLNFRVIAPSGDNPQAQLAAVRNALDNSYDISALLGFSQGANTLNQIQSQYPGYQYIPIAGSNPNPGFEIPGVGHMNQVAMYGDYLSDQTPWDVATQTATPNTDYSYLEQYGGHSTDLIGQNANIGSEMGFNPDFAARLEAAGQAYQAATGNSPVYGEADRGPEIQDIYYQAYLLRQRGLPVPEEWQALGASGGIAAPPGGSQHQGGNAMDLPSSGFRDWLYAGNAATYGIQFPVRGDVPHSQPILNWQPSSNAVQDAIQDIQEGPGAYGPAPVSGAQQFYGSPEDQSFPGGYSGGDITGASIPSLGQESQFNYNIPDIGQLLAPQAPGYAASGGGVIGAVLPQFLQTIINSLSPPAPPTFDSVAGPIPTAEPQPLVTPPDYGTLPPEALPFISPDYGTINTPTDLFGFGGGSLDENSQYYNPFTASDPRSLTHGMLPLAGNVFSGSPEQNVIYAPGNTTNFGDVGSYTDPNNRGAFNLTINPTGQSGYNTNYGGISLPWKGDYGQIALVQAPNGQWQYLPIVDQGPNQTAASHGEMDILNASLPGFGYQNRMNMPGAGWNVQVINPQGPFGGPPADLFYPGAPLPLPRPNVLGR